MPVLGVSRRRNHAKAKIWKEHWLEAQGLTLPFKYPWS
jgi:hypothetical protein